jgi:hypothetical protein
LETASQRQHPLIEDSCGNGATMARKQLMYRASEAFRPEDIEAEGSGSSIIVSDISSLAIRFALRLPISILLEGERGLAFDKLRAYCSLAMVLSRCLLQITNRSKHVGKEGLSPTQRYFSFVPISFVRKRAFKVVAQVAAIYRKCRNFEFSLISRYV